MLYQLLNELLYKLDSHRNLQKGCAMMKMETCNIGIRHYGWHHL